MKKQNKYDSYCFSGQNDYDYHEFENVMCEKGDDELYLFPKRILVFQMK